MTVSKEDVPAVKQDNDKRLINMELGYFVATLVVTFVLINTMFAAFIMKSQEDTLRTLLADIRGPAGPAGPRGMNGCPVIPPGIQGITGPPGIYIDEKGRATDAPSRYEMYVDKSASHDKKTKFVFNEKAKKKELSISASCVPGMRDEL